MEKNNISGNSVYLQPPTSFVVTRIYATLSDKGIDILCYLKGQISGTAIYFQGCNHKRFANTPPIREAEIQQKSFFKKGYSTAASLSIIPIQLLYSIFFYINSVLR